MEKREPRYKMVHFDLSSLPEDAEVIKTHWNVGDRRIGFMVWSSEWDVLGNGEKAPEMNGSPPIQVSRLNPKPGDVFLVSVPDHSSPSGHVDESGWHFTRIIGALLGDIAVKYGCKFIVLPDSVRMEPAPPAETDASLQDVPACVCGEPHTEGVVHRKDGPCFLANDQNDRRQESWRDRPPLL
jgi:hypothetical protein